VYACPCECVGWGGGSLLRKQVGGWGICLWDALLSDFVLEDEGRLSSELAPKRLSKMK